MEWGNFTDDELDEAIVRAEEGVARLRAMEMPAIAEKRARKTHIQDGYRSIVDWVAARADVSHKTARRLCWTSSRLAEARAVAKSLSEGEITFDRAEQVCRLPEGNRDAHERYDISQLRRLVAQHRRLSSKREKEESLGYLQFQPSPDEASEALWGELPGTDSMLVKKAVDQRADEILDSSAGLGVAERRALALVSICQDSLYDETAPEDTPASDVLVVVDARSAAHSNGESGVSVLGGPRIGRKALEGVMCNAIAEVIGIAENGRPLDLGRKTRTVSPALRRFVLARDMGCAVDGCSSSYRLEVHHTIPFSEGGSTDAEDLVTLCWFHHQVAIHRLGHGILLLGESWVRLVRSN
ncbi:MAG: DUF222 domain-containing protein [Acidimicrobiia bacterium]|jgi:hypothetical protein